MATNGHNGGTMRMQLKAMTVASLAIVGMLGLSSTVACSKISAVRAMMAYKQANQAYQHQDYQRAASLYEETIQANPDMAQVYFYLGNSYDNLYKPGASDPANIELLDKAVKNYQLGAEKLSGDKPEDVKQKALTMQYLVAAYGPDKLNDPVKAEPVIQRLIRLDPSEPANYFALAKLYEDAGAYDDAEKMLLYAKQAKPSDPAVYVMLAGYYSRQGRLDKTIEMLEERAQKEPNNPEAFYAIATYYWDAAYHGVGVQDKDKKQYVEKGIDAIDRAIQVRPEYMEALVYKNLLLRLQANIEKDPAKQQALIKQADTLRDKAEEIKNRKAKGLSD
jgi:tetratricopeptide (TPR) repeat protein